MIIVETIVSMCKRLDSPVTAEGVETREQFELLKNISCSKIQGYLFSRPIPVEQFTKNLINI